ncbi:histone acetyltransferase HPA2 and related acetyltransferases [Pelotomaculum thermopropionicum SI]|uniref:Histone acetyltransferase HPA2 and related acetyltransferases n=1 Tax=Pelotomaculum thermopropionicum (strain DSM 13744 / JCM 10971 / SI) TaxID=370438 RepID=A5CZK6_PELTS|nr:histone acetyltransferase HPA2 and related acetyltransferases [Pelotomaculum thermopropionicum SI]
MPADGKYSVWKRIFSVEPHNAIWHEFILANEEDEIIGKIRTLESPPGSGICWIESLSVNPGFKRRGWGSKLLDVALENARNMGYRCILGELVPDECTTVDQLIAFYRKNGFKITRKEDVFHPVIEKILL